MRSDADRVRDISILGATAKIMARITVGPDIFQSDEMLQIWAIHLLQVIGEAARGISQSLKIGIPRYHGRNSWRCGTSSCMNTSV